jgi:hypothetical protein
MIRPDAIVWLGNQLVALRREFFLKHDRTWETPARPDLQRDLGDHTAGVLRTGSAAHRLFYCWHFCAPAPGILDQ